MTIVVQGSHGTDGQTDRLRHTIRNGAS